MSDSAPQFYTQLAEFYEELFPADPETVDLVEQEARAADMEKEHSISNTLLVLSTDEVEHALEAAGFGEIAMNSSSSSRTVCATLTHTETY